MPREAILNLTNKIPQQPRFFCSAVHIMFLISVSSFFLFLSGNETS